MIAIIIVSKLPLATCIEFYLSFVDPTRTWFKLRETGYLPWDHPTTIADQWIMW